MKPKVILFTAISLDGRTTGFAVDVELFYSLASQWGENATLAGSNTLLAAIAEQPEDDNSEVSEPEPLPNDTRPILVVPDSQGRIKHWQFLRSQPYWQDYVALCTARTPKSHIAYLQRKAIKTIMAGDEQVNLSQALDVLNAEYGVTVVRVDSGGILNGVLLKEGLVDELHLLVHPTLVGGQSQKIFFADPSPHVGKKIELRYIGTQEPKPGILLLSYALANTTK